MSGENKPQNKGQIGVRLSAESQVLRMKLAKKLGVPMTAVIEIGIRKLAEAEGVKIEPGDLK